MSSANLDLWQLLFFAGAGLLVSIQAFRGWRLGIVRQIVEILAVASAYATAYFLGPRFAPLLRSLAVPDQVLTVIAGTAAGFVVYMGIRIAGAIVFKRTAQQGVGLIRVAFGLSGALVGAVFGLFIVWALTCVIRICGSLAETRVKASEMAQASGRAVLRTTLPELPGWMVGLVHMKEALESGTTGEMMKQVDPLPSVLYSTIGRIGAMLSNQQSVDRFLSYPGIQPLAKHPKIIALREDQQIVRQVMNSDYVGLLHNARVVQAANDSEIVALLRRVDVQKALDYALSNAEKPYTASPPR